MCDILCSLLAGLRCTALRPVHIPEQRKPIKQKRGTLTVRLGFGRGQIVRSFRVYVFLRIGLHDIVISPVNVAITARRRLHLDTTVDQGASGIPVLDPQKVIVDVGVETRFIIKLILLATLSWRCAVHPIVHQRHPRHPRHHTVPSIHVHASHGDVTHGR